MKFYTIRLGELERKSDPEFDCLRNARTFMVIRDLRNILDLAYLLLFRFIFNNISFTLIYIYISSSVTSFLVSHVFNMDFFFFEAYIF